MSQPVCIEVDWGSSNFRAYLCAANGEILDRRFSPHGIFKLKQANLSSFLQHELKDWLVRYTQLPILLCGMIGSASGWVETPYLDCPLDLSRLAQHLVEVPSGMQRAVRIVPGVQRLATTAAAGDVMRGEETQVLGAVLLNLKQSAVAHTGAKTGDESDLQAAGALSHESAAEAAADGIAALSSSTEQHVLCMPGTHSKWVLVQGGVMQHFRTLMTGELFALLLQVKSIARQLKQTGYQQSINRQLFIRGVAAARQGDGLLADVFGVRVQLLQQQLAPTEVRDYLSGLLIANEIQQAAEYTQLQLPITLIASGNLATRYKLGFEAFDLPYQVIASEQVTQTGLHAIAKQAGLFAV